VGKWVALLNVGISIQSLAQYRTGCTLFNGFTASISNKVVGSIKLKAQALIISIQEDSKGMGGLGPKSTIIVIPSTESI